MLVLMLCHKTLICHPHLENTGSMNLDEFVLQVSTQEQSISHLLTASPKANLPLNSLNQEQRKDPKLVVFFDYLGKLLRQI